MPRSRSNDQPGLAGLQLSADQLPAEWEQSTQFLRATLDALSTHIAILDETGKILEVNRAWRRFAEQNGLTSPAACVGVDYLAICDATEGPERAVARTVSRGIRDLLRGERERLYAEYPCHSPEVQRWFAMRATAFVDGDARRVVVAHEDITERKQAEQAVSGMGGIIEESLNEIYIFDAETLKFIRVNRGARENLGYSMDELRELTPIDIKPEFSHSDFEELLRPLRCGEQKKLVLTTVHRRRDGSVYDVEVHLQPSDFEGALAFVAIILDITERRRAEEALRREHDFAQSLVETAQAIVLVLDVHGRIVQFNPFMEELSGYRLTEVQGQDWFETFLPHQDWSRIRTVFRRAVHDERIRGNVNPILTRDGREREIAWWDQTLKDSDGSIIGVLAIGHDVTDLKEAQRKALQSERLAAIGEMATGLAHESRNALQRSQACLEMLAVEVESQPAAVDLVRRIQSAQDHLYRLYEEVREYAAPISVECKQCDLAEVWRDTWNHLQPVPTARNIQLREVLERVDTTCCADPFAMGQVFRNVLENAIAAVPDPGVITVRCRDSVIKGRPALEVSFLDNGPGLTPDQKQKLLHPFFTTKTKGTGLGMAIAWRIMEAHGGSIAVGRSLRPGAEIVVTLPRETA